MNCGQVKRNEAFYPCTEPADCCQHRPELCEAGYTGTARWECNQGSCYAHPAEDIRISRRPLNLDASYKLATNDYIARGGSGFDMLKRNTTKVDSGIPLRDALIEFLGRFPTCRQILSADPNTVDPFALTFCQDLESPERADALVVKGACSCLDLRRGDLRRCRSVGPALQKFCASPNDFPIVLGEPDGRIQRKVN